MINPKISKLLTEKLKLYREKSVGKSREYIQTQNIIISDLFDFLNENNVYKESDIPNRFKFILELK